MFQLKISLRDSRPPIWRRVLVPEQTPLSTLHRVIQLSFGWNNEHLYMFEKGCKGSSSNDYRVWGEEDECMGNATVTPLWSTLQSEGDKLIYTYDFGDWWDFTVLLEKQTHDTSQQPIRCLGGKGTTPVENSGGLLGYTEMLLQAIDAENPDQAEIHSFLMQDIDNRRYDLSFINSRLQALN